MNIEVKLELMVQAYIHEHTSHKRALVNYVRVIDNTHIAYLDSGAELCIRSEYLAAFAYFKE
jgi:S-methylmethionine-dependent homocysteine/selenocysteine methylase